MSARVMFAGNAYGYAFGGGHLWEYLSLALGLRRLGCEVIWVEGVPPADPPEAIEWNIDFLKRTLERYGFETLVPVSMGDDFEMPQAVKEGFPSPESLEPADLLVSLTYRRPPARCRFRRAALMDIDPGLLQLWMTYGWVDVSGYDTYFTIGETVGQPDAAFPHAGVEWHYLPRCIDLDSWPLSPTSNGAPFSTISHWIGDEWLPDGDDGWYLNDKRTGFLPFLDLPGHTDQPLELALCFGREEEREELTSRGWRVCEANDVTRNPWDYQDYIARSRGEFSCAKPSCIRLQNAWISGRTLAYMASGKPAIVQDTGPSSFLPRDEGLFRFSDLDGAVRGLESAAADYERQGKLARAFVEEHFDSRTVAIRLLETALA